MKVKKVRPLTHCDSCGGEIWASNVFKTVAIPNSVGHLALVYRCATCEMVGKAAASNDDWEKAQALSEEHSAHVLKVMTAAHIDVESIETVGDLLAEWASFPPPIREEIMHLCNCKDCKRRLYRGES